MHTLSNHIQKYEKPSYFILGRYYLRITIRIRIHLSIRYGALIAYTYKYPTH